VEQDGEPWIDLPSRVYPAGRTAVPGSSVGVLHCEHPGEEGPCKTAEMISPRLSDEMAARATLLAMCVRNAMEGTVHGGELGQASLTDEQLAALNPIVRNAIATGLHAESQYFKEMAARSYLDFQSALVPSYWARPELLDDYKELWDRVATEPKVPEVVCKRCGREVVNIGGAKQPRWSHLAADGGLTVGCRAASFTPSDGWEDIPKSWKAVPGHTPRTLDEGK